MCLLGNLYMELAKVWQQEVSSISTREPEASQPDWDGLHFKKLKFILYQISFHFVHACRKTVRPTHWLFQVSRAWLSTPACWIRTQGTGFLQTGLPLLDELQWTQDLGLSFHPQVPYGLIRNSLLLQFSVSSGSFEPGAQNTVSTRNGIVYAQNFRGYQSLL